MKKLTYCLLLFIPLLWSCEQPEKPTFKTVEDLQVTKLTQDEVIIEGKAVIYNPNAFSIEVIGTELDVKVNDVEVGRVEQNERTEVSGKSDFRVPLVIKFPPEKVFQDKGLLGGLMNAIFKKKVDLYYKGTVTVSALGVPIDIPVEAQKEVKLKKSKEAKEETSS